jgi:hypothetical protein
MKKIKTYGKSKSDVPTKTVTNTRNFGLRKISSVMHTAEHMSINDIYTARLRILKSPYVLIRLGFVLLTFMLGACRAPVHKSTDAALAASPSVNACLPQDDGSLIAPGDCNALYQQALENMWSYSINQSGPSPKEQRFSPLLNNGYVPPARGLYSRFVTFTSAGDRESPADLLYNSDSNTYQTLKSSNSSPINVWVSQMEDFRNGFCDNVTVLRDSRAGQYADPANIAGYASSLLQGLPPIWFNKTTQQWVPSMEAQGYKDHGLYVIFLPYTMETVIPAYKSQQGDMITLEGDKHVCSADGSPCIVRVSINGVGLAKGTGTNLYPRETNQYDHALWGVEWSESWPYNWIANASYYQLPGASFSCGDGELSCISSEKGFYPWTGLSKTANWVYAHDAPSMVYKGSQEFIMPGNLRFKNSGTEPSQLLSASQSFEGCDSAQSSFCFIPAAQMEEALCK